MDHNDAFEVGWLSKIEWLRRLLNDQYLTGLPIIKELLQNADDARASRLEIALVPGLTQNSHAVHHNPLFDGPAMMIVNDGQFTDDNAVSIRQLGLSNKPGEVGAIGRFGLGLKSVFHLGEAFFYLSNDRSPRMLNPWSGSGEHATWTTINETHQQHMRAQIARVMDRDPWFCLWIPLRKQSHASSFGFIKRDFLLDECPDLMRALFPGNTTWELSGTLPMLRHVRQIRLWNLQQSNSPQVSISSSAGRRFEGLIRRTEHSKLCGTLSVSSENCPAVDRQFSGIEHQVLLEEQPTLSELFQDSHWPVNSGVRSNGAYFQEKAKAVAHGAAYFHAGSSSPAGKVRGTWAVFLPIETPLALDDQWSGDTDIGLTLHGYFFVDSGRRHVQFASDAVAIDSEEALQKQWNRRLRDTIVLPLVIPALSQFVTDNGCSSPDTARLTKAIQQSAFFQQHRISICRCEQFIPRLVREGISWQKVATQPLFALPSPPASNHSVAWEIFPGLERVEQFVVAADQPALSRDENPADWTPEMAEALAEVAFDKVIADVDSLAYFVASWQFITHGGPTSTPHRALLRDVVRRMFAEVPLRQILEHADAIKRLIGCLKPDGCFAIPTPNNSTQAVEVLQSLYQLPLGSLLVPDALISAGLVPSGKLDPADARRILDLLGQGPVGATPGTNYHLWRSKVACCIFANLTAERSLLRQEYADQRWFPTAVHTTGDIKVMLGTINEFVLCSTKDVLFAGPLQKNEWAIALQSALVDRKVLIVTEQVASLLAPEYQTRQLRAEEVVRTLGKCPPLAAPPLREALVRLLISNCDEVTLATAEFRSGVRYILRGEPELPGVVQNLLVEPDTAIEPVWLKLMAQLRQTGDATSRVVDPILAAHINIPKRAVLGLKLIGRGSIPDEIRQLGAERINCDSLTDQDINILLRHPDDSDVLRGLRIHRRVNSDERVSIQETCYWSDGRFSTNDPQLLKHVLLLQLSKDPVIAARQRQLLPAEWNPRSAIEVVAAQPRPSDHFSAVLDALTFSSDSDKPARLQQLDALAWLPLRNGGAIEPRNVVFWPEYQDDLDPLLPAGCSVVPYSRLHAQVHQDNRWKLLSKDILPPRIEALRMLGQTLAVQDSFRIGPVAEGNFDVVVFRQVFRNATQVMPVWKVVDRIPSNWTEQTAQFVRPLLAPIGVERLIDILNYLAHSAHGSDESELREQCRSVYLWYLRAAASRSDFKEAILPRIMFLNRRGRWKHAADLCVGAMGIDGTAVLNEEHWAVIRGKVATNDSAQSADDGSLAAGNSTRNLTPEQVQARIDDGAEQIIALCRRLESVTPPAAIGGLLCMLGDHPRILEVAQEYIGQVSPRTFRAKVDWNRGEHPSGPFSSIAEAIGAHRYLIEVSDDRTVPVLNLMGSEFKAPVQTDFSHFLLGRISLVAGANGLVRFTRRVRFRSVAPEQLAGLDCNQLFFETAARLLEDVFEQHDRSVMEDMWSDLLKTDQMDVRIAKEYILDSAFTYLQTVMGRGANERLIAIWRRWDLARRQRVEAEIVGHNRQTWLQDAESQARQARDDLRQLLTEDSRIQHEVLEAIRRKITSQYQYTSQSILFELFQNADDAAVETNDLYGASEPVPDETSHIAVQVTSQTLRVLHWGRPVNKFMSHALNETRGRSLGYDQDLEKMLMLARSDKTNSNGSRQRTGKFGLGFKSVFLVSDVPRVLSGRLAFEVVGGFLPERLEDADRQRMRQLCEDLRITPGDTTAECTLFELALTPAVVDFNEICQSFRRLVGYLLIFARQIKMCRLDILDHPSECIGWFPRSSIGNGLFQVGVFAHSEGSGVASETVLVMRGDSFSLIFGWGNSGFVSLPADVPAIWVTAPTQEPLRTGFAINANFDVDVGRASLVEVSSHNQALAQQLGLEIARQLRSLYAQTESDLQWSELREALSLDLPCEPYSLWESLWDIGADEFARRTSATDSVACELVRRMLWGGPLNGLACLYSECKSLPSKLDVEGYRVPTTIHDITHLLTGCLDQDSELLSLVSCWESFRARLKPRRIVSYSRVWRVLRGLSDDLSSDALPTIDLANVLEWESELAQTIGAEQAKRIGQVVNRDLLDRLQSGQSQDRVEANRLHELLGKLEFLANDGRYHPASQLLIGVECDERPEEERMRAAFASDERVLNESYTGDALRLFLVCRQQMTATVQDMVEWALSADTEVKREGVLEYLHHGDNALMLAVYLRSHGLTDTWLADHRALFVGASVAGPTNPIAAAISAILGSGSSPSGDDLFNNEDEPPEVEAGPTFDASALLPTIWEWWDAEGDSLAAEYSSTLYPPELTPPISAEDPSDDRAARKSWLVLLIRGMLETFGRTRAEQHLGFLRLCNEHGWLDQLIENERPSHAFLASVEAYIDDQRHTVNIQYFHWLRQFLGLATVASHLDVYSRAFLDIDRIPGDFALDLVLRPRMNPAYRGTDMDAPPLDPALGIGVCFVARELVRCGVLHRNRHVHQYCFVPVKGVRDLFVRMGCDTLQREPSDPWLSSKLIYQFILEQFDGDTEMASLRNGFDLPFYLISSRSDLQQRLLGTVIT